VTALVVAPAFPASAITSSAACTRATRRWA